MVGKTVKHFFRNDPFGRLRLALSGLAALAVLAACASATSPAPSSDQDQQLQVVATTTILGDVVQQVGGETIALRVLLPSGSDPHTFEPTPKDVAAISKADLVIINGAGLEEFLARLLESASAGGGELNVMSASEGIDLRTSADAHPEEDHPEEGELTSFDPHIWFDP